MRHIGFGKIAPPGRHRRHQRDRAGGARHHLLHRRGVPAGRLHGRHHRPLLLPVRHHGLGRRADLAVRVVHAGPDAVVGLVRPAGPRHRPLRPHRQRRPGARQRHLSRRPGLGAALAQAHAPDRPGDLPRQLRSRRNTSASSSCPRPTSASRSCRSRRRSARRWNTPRPSCARSTPRCASSPRVDYTYGTVNTGYAVRQEPGEPVPAAEAAEGAQALAQRSSPSRLRDRLASIPGILASINIPGGPGGGVQKQLQLSLQGPDMAVLDKISQDVMRRAADDPRPGRPRPQPQGRQAGAVGAAAPRRRLRPRPRLGAGGAVAQAPVRRRRDQPVARARRRELHRHGPPAGRRPHRRRRPAAHLVHRRHRAQRPAAHGPHRPDRRRRERRRRLADQPARPQPRGLDHRQRLGPLRGRGLQRPAEAPGRDQAAAGLPLRVRRLDQGHGRECGLCRPGAAAGGDPDLPDPGLAVRLLPAAHRHHDVAADVADRRVPGAADRRHHAQHLLAPSASSC